MSLLAMANSLMFVISILDGSALVAFDCQRNIVPDIATDAIELIMNKFARKM